jgi:hypothetical protein
MILSLLLSMVSSKMVPTHEELLANALDRQNGFSDVTILRSFTADDGQKYVALQWPNQDDCCIEYTEQPL